jgi:hypothetical protein
MLSGIGAVLCRHRKVSVFTPQSQRRAACFLDFDGLIVPSARSTELNLVIFTEKLDVGERLKVQASEPVDWSAWRSQHRVRSRRNG